MAGITTGVGMSAVTQSAFQQLQLQQARQNADRAEQAARALKAQAADAQLVADRAQQDARDLSVRSGRAQTLAGLARQGVVVAEAGGAMQARLSTTLDQVITRQTAGPATADVPAPVMNTSGQLTGQVVNTTA